MSAAPLGLRGHPKADGEAGGLKRGTRYTGRCSRDTYHTSSPTGCWSGAEGLLCLLKGRVEERPLTSPSPAPPPPTPRPPGPQVLGLVSDLEPSHFLAMLSPPARQGCWLDLIPSQPPVSLNPLLRADPETPGEKLTAELSSNPRGLGQRAWLSRPVKWDENQTEMVEGNCFFLPAIETKANI